MCHIEGWLSSAPASGEQASERDLTHTLVSAAAAKPTIKAREGIKQTRVYSSTKINQSCSNAKYVLSERCRYGPEQRTQRYMTGNT